MFKLTLMFLYCDDAKCSRFSYMEGANTRQVFYRGVIVINKMSPVFSSVVLNILSKPRHLICNLPLDGL